MDATNRINELMANAIYDKFKCQRYGIRTCRTTVDPDLLMDLQTLYKRASEMTSCDLAMSSCSVTKIEEKINTL